MSIKNQKSALISVFNKDRIGEIAQKLTDLNINIISTGGTEKFLKNLGYKVEKISFSDDIENISATNIRKEMNITPVKHDVQVQERNQR